MRVERIRDPHPGDDRPVADGGWGYKAGRWPGAPIDALPPGCPVTALGRDADNNYWFLDSMQQLNSVHRDKWGKKTLLDLFNNRPHYLQHHWPRWSAIKKDQEIASTMNGVEVDNAAHCLMYACAGQGAIEIDSKVRGRGAWKTRTGRLIWHAGDALYSITGGKLQGTGPAAVENVVYPGGAPILVPWREPVGMDGGPAQDLLGILKSWNFERPKLDPLIIIGGLGCCFLGGALDWRPYLFFSGGAGVGKSTLQNMIRAILGDALIKGANVTEASIRQLGRRDSLAIAVDEFEARSDNRKTAAVIELARIAASGDDILRGGADHHAAKFTMRSTFMFSAINPPPMEPADQSRMAMINLAPLDKSRGGKEPNIDADLMGRMLLRGLMDAWPNLQRTLGNWRDALRSAGFSDRAQMTYGTLMAMAELMLGPEVMEAEGLPMTDAQQLGDMLRGYTEIERSNQTENWVDCVQAILSAPIDAWKDGQKPTVGSVLEQMTEARGGVLLDEMHANNRLRLVGLKVLLRGMDDGQGERIFLAVPTSVRLGPEMILGNTKFGGGVWNSALKQAPANVVVRHLGAGQVVRINKSTSRAQLIDLAAWDAWQDKQETE